MASVEYERTIELYSKLIQWNTTSRDEPLYGIVCVIPYYWLEKGTVLEKEFLKHLMGLWSNKLRQQVKARYTSLVNNHNMSKWDANGELKPKSPLCSLHEFQEKFSAKKQKEFSDNYVFVQTLRSNTWWITEEELNNLTK